MARIQAGAKSGDSQLPEKIRPRVRVGFVSERLSRAAKDGKKIELCRVQYLGGAEVGAKNEALFSMAVVTKPAERSG
jgi:hypothetical protein